MAVLGDDDVLGLDVAVHDAGAVRGSERVGDSGGHRDPLANRFRSLRRHHVAQRRTGEQFLHDVVRPAVDAHVIDGRNVGMTQRGGRPGFLFEAGQPLRVGREERRQNLDGHLAPEPRVPGAIDLTHAAGAEWRDDFVGAEARSRRQRHVEVPRL